MRSLGFITPSIISLTKLVHVLKAGHSFCNYSGGMNKLTYTDKKHNKSILDQYEKKLHLLKPQMWRLLKPNDEMRTKHLKWRK
ncbi:conserved protein, unknown function [Hepatocystis sp. ex Piliocolobus tephrosceles]|nr:conserved protein, unknown function [Hepatocystis sp. ex Piliocolobus tephrosceles]